MDVLVAGLEHEGAVLDLVLHLVERTEQDGHLVIAEESPATQPTHVGARADQVVDGQPTVEVQAHRVVHDHVGGPAAEPAVPEGHRPAPRPSWMADHVATPRPHSRTKPSASWWRKVSVAS